jgi:type VI secretion system protein
VLILQVSSYQSDGMKQLSRKTLDTGILSIGRAETNDWPLSDNDRILSKKHCTIECQNGNYILADLSSNGVFLNTSADVIGRGNTVQLKQGDIIRLSDYEISVSFENTVAAPIVPGIPRVEEPRATRPPPPVNVIPDGGDWKSILETDNAAVIQTPTESLAVEVPGFAQSHYDAPTVGMSIPDDWGMTADNEINVPVPDMPVPAAQVPDMMVPEPQVSEPQIPEPQVPDIQVPTAQVPDMQVQQPIVESPVSANVSTQSTNAPASASTSDSSDNYLIQAFLKGAGLDPQLANSHNPEQLMIEMGSLFRKSTAGLMGVLAARGDIKSEFRLSQTMIKPTENNPLKFSLNIEESMMALMSKKGAGYMAADTAFEEAFDDLKAHQVAVLSGMQSALKNLLKRFDPELIRAGDDVSGMQKMLGGKKSKYWDDFVRLYATLSRDAEDDFQNVFGREFGKAYEKQIYNQKINKN